VLLCLPQNTHDSSRLAPSNLERKPARRGTGISIALLAVMPSGSSHSEASLISWPAVGGWCSPIASGPCYLELSSGTLRIHSPFRFGLVPGGFGDRQRQSGYKGALPGKRAAILFPELLASFGVSDISHRFHQPVDVSSLKVLSGYRQNHPGVLIAQNLPWEFYRAYWRSSFSIRVREHRCHICTALTLRVAKKAPRKLRTGSSLAYDMLRRERLSFGCVSQTTGSSKSACCGLQGVE